MVPVPLLLFTFTCFWLLLFQLTFGQSPAAGIFGQLNLPGGTFPDYNNQQQQYRGVRPPPSLYTNTLWPFASSSSDNGGGAYFGGLSSRPMLYQPPSPYYGWPMPQQQSQQPVQLNDLIAELSVALVRSFAQMLAEREIGGGGGGRVGGPFGGSKGDNVFGLLPFAQPPQPAAPSPYGGRTSTNFGYGVNAGVFAGTYGGSDSIASPYGPYGPMNSQIGGGPYSGLSPWPYIPGRPPPPPPPSTANNTSRPAAPQPAPPPPADGVPVGEGSVVQIPLTENVQGGGIMGEGSGGGELPVPAEAG